MSDNDSIRDNYSPRQYFNKLLREGLEPHIASNIVNSIYGDK